MARKKDQNIERALEIFASHGGILRLQLLGRFEQDDKEFKKCCWNLLDSDDGICKQVHLQCATS